ncbi:MAG: DsbC family protein [Acinetobacter sp.]
MIKRRLLWLAYLWASCSYADVTHLSQQLKTQYPNLNFENIAATEVNGLYSALLNQKVVYLDEKGEHIFVGTMIRLKDQKNLTQELSTTRSSQSLWQQLRFQDAIKIVKGNGQQQLAIFSDPNCPYCKKLESQLDQLQNVTMYIFLYPLRPQSMAQSKQVWCSENRDYVWKNLIQRGISPKAEASCANPIQRNLDFGKKYRFVGTPTLIFPNGKQITGYTTVDKIRENF